MEQDIRWQQRFDNLQRAFTFLQTACKQEEYTHLEEAGVVQSFEFTFELAWKTLKDYLEQKGLNPRFPRDVIKDAFRMEIIDKGEIWIRMLEKRNELSHTYNESSARKAVQIIKQDYFPCILQLYNYLKKEL